MELDGTILTRPKGSRKMPTLKGLGESGNWFVDIDDETEELHGAPLSLTISWL
jgi:hypothetical protein